MGPEYALKRQLRIASPAHVESAAGMPAAVKKGVFHRREPAEVAETAALTRLPSPARCAA